MASTGTSGQTTGPLFESIKKDHRDIYKCHDMYKSAGNDLDAKERWARQLTWEVARHSIGEELVVYPLFEKHLGAKGKQMADGDRADHMEVKKMLYELEQLKPGQGKYDELVDTMMKTLHEHADSEETHDLPELEAVLKKQDSQEAAASFQRTKKFVPTRSHPSAPDQPPLETLAGLMAAPMDKLKDAFSKFPTDEMKQQSKSSY
ncbi:hypothetical protein M0805_000108 [Coniferiporia weirii]|nr:hypothetical protein M0805_000108 [Coniferiporia weirii]